jgi:hypothetical protein
VTRKTEELIIKYFGDEVEVKKLFGGYRISRPSDGGTVDFRAGAIEKLSGGSDIFTGALGMLHEINGRVVVRSSQETILAVLAHGEANGIPVIAELDKTRFQKGLAFSVVTFCVLIGLAITHSWDEWWDGMLWGLGAAVIVERVAYIIFHKQLTKAGQTGGDGAEE